MFHVPQNETGVARHHYGCLVEFLAEFVAELIQDYQVKFMSFCFSDFSVDQIQMVV